MNCISQRISKNQTMDRSCPTSAWWIPSGLQRNCTTFNTHERCTVDCGCRSVN